MEVDVCIFGVFPRDLKKNHSLRRVVTVLSRATPPLKLFHSKSQLKKENSANRDTTDTINTVTKTVYSSKYLHVQNQNIHTFNQLVRNGHLPSAK